MHKEIIMFTVIHMSATDYIYTGRQKAFPTSFRPFVVLVTSVHVREHLPSDSEEIQHV